MKKLFISTSLPYVNSSPHLGFALEIIQADAIARYHRILGEDVFFLTGTDEHGSKIARKAEELNKKPQEFVDEISHKFRELKDVLNLSNSDFIRTTDRKRHWPTVHKVWQKLKENGDIYKKKYKGLYCVGCESFLTKRDLVDGKCPIHKKEPEVIEEENYFFKLSRYQDQLKEILESNQIKIFPELRKNEMLNFVKDGLEDVSCSRDKSKVEWGVPVPDDDNQKIYVWFEALINYISALDYSENSDKFNKYWPADVHCIGKDITRFHLLLWPAMLLSLGLDLPKHVLIHGFLTVDGEKMSKSIGNVIDPLELVKKYGIDPVRYFLLREITPTEDGDFTYEKFEQRYNADLASGLGNLVSRIITMAEKSECGIKVVNEFQNPNALHASKMAKKKYKEAMKILRFNEALTAVWEFISFCDKYIEQEKPWECKEEDNIVISDLLAGLVVIAELLQPFMPETSDQITKQLKKGKSEALFPRL